MAKKSFQIDENSSVDFGVIERDTSSSLENVGVIKKRKTIDINKLIPNPLNMYDLDLDGEEFYELCDSIKKDGILSPLIVKKMEDDNYMILSGHRRLEAAKKIGLSTVPTEIKAAEELTKAEEIAFIGRGNVGVRKKKPFDIAKQIKMYYEELDKNGIEETIKETAKAFSVSERSMYSYDLLSCLPISILDLGNKRLLTSEDALTLAKNLRNDNTEKITQNIFGKMENAKDSKEIQEILSTYKRNLESKSSKIKGKKPVSIMGMAKKAENIFSVENYTAPKNSKEREKTKQYLIKTKERIEKILSEL